MARWLKILSFLLIFIFLPHFVSAKNTVTKADKILVEKSKRQLTLMHKGVGFKTYKISLGRTPLGAKTQQGDGKTPEGKYSVDWRNSKSLYHKSLHVSYPNAADEKHAAALGVAAGGMVMIHGLPNGFSFAEGAGQLVDWTDGCIAVNNGEMDEIWKTVPDGTEIEIVP